MSVVSPDVRNARPAGELVTLTIDGRQVSVPRGTTVLRAALQAGIYIPHLCDFRDLAPTPAAGCASSTSRRCAGSTPPARSRRARAWSSGPTPPTVREYQRGVLEVILSDHPDRCFTCNRYERCEPLGICQRDDLVLERCLTCAKNRQCELQRVADFLGLREQRFENPRRVRPARALEPLHRDLVRPLHPLHSLHASLRRDHRRVGDRPLAAAASPRSRSRHDQPRDDPAG